MKRFKILGVIPARYSSSRFPGKPLADIFGKPMIQWVYERSGRSKLIDKLIVATDDERILNTVIEFGGEAIMTPNNIRTGTDRVAYVAKRFTSDIIVNIQGDEPLISPQTIDKTIEAILDDPSADVSTPIKKISDPKLISDPNVVKVVFDKNNYAIYFSRSPIPYMGESILDVTSENRGYFKHIGLYVYKRDSLIRFVNLEESELERMEKLEQLRAIENGFKIKVVPAEFDSISVDTPDDLVKVKEFILKNKSRKFI